MVHRDCKAPAGATGKGQLLIGGAVGGVSGGMAATPIIFHRRKRSDRKQRMAALAPSPWWVAEITAKPPRVKTFPPRADHSPMLRCQSRHDHRFYPEYYFHECPHDTSKVWCEECHQNWLLAEEQRWEREERQRNDGTFEDEEVTTLADELPTLSRFGEALIEMQAQRGVMPEKLKEPLASVDESDLRAEIAAAQQHGVKQ